MFRRILAWLGAKMTPYPLASALPAESLDVKGECVNVDNEALETLPEGKEESQEEALKIEEPTPVTPVRKKVTIKSILKALIHFVFPKLDGIDDPIERKKLTLKYRIRKFFILDPEADEEKLYKFGKLMVPREERITHADVFESTIRENLIDYWSESFARLSELAIFHPLDTVKVKQETFPHIYKSMIKSLIMTYEKDSWRGLYAGAMPAMVATMAEHSVLFVAYEGSQISICKVLEIENAEELSVFGNGCAGSLAAFFSSFALCPTELVKCKIQVLQEIKAYVPAESELRLMSPFQLTSKIYKTDGYFFKPWRQVGTP